LRYHGCDSCEAAQAVQEAGGVNRGIKLVIYILTLGFASWFPPVFFFYANFGPPNVVGAIQGVILVAVVIGGLVWVLWPEKNSN
jgi:hypothetical protein